MPKSRSNLEFHTNSRLPREFVCKSPANGRFLPIFALLMKMERWEASSCDTGMADHFLDRVFAREFNKMVCFSIRDRKNGLFWGKRTEVM